MKIAIIRKREKRVEMPAPKRPSSGRPARAVNQGVVQDDVDQVADEQNPHGRPRVHDAVGELLESVEQQDEDERAEQDEVIRLDQGDEFGRLVQVVDVEEQYGHAQYEDEGDNEIGQ